MCPLEGADEFYDLAIADVDGAPDIAEIGLQGERWWENQQIP